MTHGPKKNRIRHLWPAAAAVGTLALLRALTGCAPTLDRGIQDPSRRVASYLDAVIEDDREVGLQYLVVSPNAVVFEYVGGRADVGTGQPVTSGTTFLSASMTKVVTAAAVLRLVEQRKVGLDDPLSKYVPSQPYGHELTVRHLLNQSSGVPNPMPLSWVHTTTEHGRFDERQALSAVLAEHGELEFTPGEKYAYSNLSYWLLGRLMEQASGARYCEFMRTEVFGPLDITPAELDCEIPEPGRHARGHQRRWSALGLLMPLVTDERIWAEPEGAWARFEHLYMNGPAYGGLVGTARGYAKFLQDMLRPQSRLLGNDARRLFFSDQHDASGRVLPTTLGWHRGRMGTIPYYSKPGGGPGVSGNVRIYRERGLATVFLSNQMRVSEGEIQSVSDTLDAELL